MGRLGQWHGRPYARNAPKSANPVAFQPGSSANHPHLTRWTSLHSINLFLFLSIITNLPIIIKIISTIDIITKSANPGPSPVPVASVPENTSSEGPIRGPILQGIPP
ncbi:uncharacterized protein DFL_008283 [Arthrobotrys flagrans]|uniref:Uncharacterized protein n=1 Tax=Arthrobotrys flagrans TaxID=97331 RepID=A0A436ZNE7_ARTFL|nr:hypothetical protein DFL_008283 [Arthrobotrys flagrans]